jgi:hypothetical protein
MGAFSCYLWGDSPGICAVTASMFDKLSRTVDRGSFPASLSDRALINIQRKKKQVTDFEPGIRTSFLYLSKREDVIKIDLEETGT